MLTLRDNDKQTARKKGTLAMAATGGAIALAVLGSPILGMMTLVPAAWLGYDWFMYRAKRGMRF